MRVTTRRPSPYPLPKRCSAGWRPRCSVRNRVLRRPYHHDAPPMHDAGAEAAVHGVHGEARGPQKAVVHGGASGRVGGRGLGWARAGRGGVVKDATRYDAATVAAPIPCLASSSHWRAPPAPLSSAWRSYSSAGHEGARVSSIMRHARRALWRAHPTIAPPRLAGTLT